MFCFTRVFQILGFYLLLKLISSPKLETHFLIEIRIHTKWFAYKLTKTILPIGKFNDRLLDRLKNLLRRVFEGSILFLSEREHLV